MTTSKGKIRKAFDKQRKKARKKGAPTETDRPQAMTDAAFPYLLLRRRGAGVWEAVARYRTWDRARGNRDRMKNLHPEWEWHISDIRCEATWSTE